MNKICLGCCLYKNVTEFGKHKNGKNGLNSKCKECHKILRTKLKANRHIKGLCIRCGVKIDSEFKNCMNCLLEIKQSITKVRLEALKQYGNKCSCCGETNSMFLTFDHINNDGYKRRPRNGYSGTSIQFWLKKNNYPRDIQILCYNCNCGRARTANRVCPHKQEEK